MIIRLQHQRADGNVDTYHLKPGRRYHIGRGSACEVRILDFKLSRKHCLVEFADGHWQVVDLGSTNGCRVDGEQIVGARRLTEGDVIALGQSSLQVARIYAIEPNGDDDGGETEIDGDTGKLLKTASVPHLVESSLEPAPRRRQRDESAESHPAAMDQQVAIEPLPLDSDSDSRPASLRLMIDNVPAQYPHWEPEPGTDFLTKTDVLTPKTPTTPTSTLPPATATPAAPAPIAHVGPGDTGAITRPPRREPASGQRPGTRIVPVVIQVGNAAGDDSAGNPALSLNALDDTAPTAPAPRRESLAETQPTVAPRSQATASAAPASRSATAVDDDRTFFITVLGRRIGPLTRAVARELKVRELKGALTPTDLETYSR